MNDRCPVQGNLSPEQNSAYGLLWPFTGRWLLVTGHWLSVSGSWQLVSGRWLLEACHWLLVAGY